MTSYRQIEANRRNALKSTGPKTEAAKQASRCNAVRHGLTAETVISTLEDAEDYKAFEAAITADYDAQSAVERELVLRLASLSVAAPSCYDDGNRIVRDSSRASARPSAKSSTAPRILVTQCTQSSRVTLPSTRMRLRTMLSITCNQCRRLPLSSSPAASCGWRICPILHSTASAGMKLLCRARRAGIPICAWRPGPPQTSGARAPFCSDSALAWSSHRIR